MVQATGTGRRLETGGRRKCTSYRSQQVGGTPSSGPYTHSSHTLTMPVLSALSCQDPDTDTSLNAQEFTVPLGQGPCCKHQVKRRSPDPGPGLFKQPYLKPRPDALGLWCWETSRSPGVRKEVPGRPVTWCPSLVGGCPLTRGGRVCTSLGPGPGGWPSCRDFFSGGPSGQGELRTLPSCCWPEGARLGFGTYLSQTLATQPQEAVKEGGMQPSARTLITHFVPE